MVKIRKFVDDVIDNNKAFPSNNIASPFPTTTRNIFSSLDDTKNVFGLDARIKNYLPENAGKWKNYDDLKRIRSGQIHSGGGELNALARYTKPYYKYDKMINEIGLIVNLTWE